MKRFLVISVCSVFFAAINCFAEPVKEHTFDLGIELSHIFYDEPNVMEEEGVMYGVSGSYTYRSKRYMLRAEGRFSYGEVDYKNSGTLDNIEDYIIEFRQLGGYDFHISETTTVTPYIGFGYRYLNDDSSGMTTTTGAKGYERESNYYYSPIGLEIITQFNNGWSIGAVLEYDHFWKGRQKSHIGDAIAGINPLENDQHKGYGLRGSLKFIKKGERIDLLIKPFIRYWDIEQSDSQAVTYSGVIVGFGYEPENNSTEYGIRLGAQF